MMRDFAFVKQEDGSVARHVFIRTQEANQIMENNNMTNSELDKFRDNNQCGLGLHQCFGF